jgi:hypothetical protein
MVTGIAFLLQRDHITTAVFSTFMVKYTEKTTVYQYIVGRSADLLKQETGDRRKKVTVPNDKIRDNDYKKSLKKQLPILLASPTPISYER